MKLFGFNERKRRTLEIFARAYPDALRPDVYAVKIGRYPARAAYSYLRRLWRFGLLVRMRGPIRYWLSDRGRRKLAWLRRRLPED